MHPSHFTGEETDAWRSRFTWVCSEGELDLSPVLPSSIARVLSAVPGPT